MRIRSVKPEFWADRHSTGRWPADMRLLYVGLWGFADDEGRFEWDLDLIRSALFPFPGGCPLTVGGAELDLEGTLARLLEASHRDGRCLVKYEVDGIAYGFLPTFKKHQHPNRPTPSKLPPPPYAASSEDSLQAHGVLREASVSPHGGKNGSSFGESENAVSVLALAGNSVSAHGGLPDDSVRVHGGLTAGGGGEQEKERRDPEWGGCPIVDRMGSRREKLERDLHETFEAVRGGKYRADRGDNRALETLLEVQDEDALGRWQAALAAPRPFEADTLAQLVVPRIWNHFAGARQRAAKAPRFVRVGPESSSTLWPAILDRCRASLRQDLVERWFAPLRARQEAQELILAAPDPFHANFFGDQYLSLVEQVALEVHGVAVVVRIGVEHGSPRAAGEGAA